MLVFWLVESVSMFSPARDWDDELQNDLFMEGSF